MKIFSGNVVKLVLAMALMFGVRLQGGEAADAVATVTAGYVTGITVTSGGSGYVSEPEVTLRGGGGSGAVGKAFLSGDKVGLIVVLSAGSGYSSSPMVEIGLPPNANRIRVELVPKLTVEGREGNVRRVEYSLELGDKAKWQELTNVVLGVKGAVVVDLAIGGSTRYYRSVDGTKPSGPADYVWIKPGTFVMGSPTSEADRREDEVQHSVTLSRGYWMSDHETTQAEYESVMGSNPSRFKGSTLPVEQVSWDEAVSYCAKLTVRELAAGRIEAGQAYRLPTEAEWEYAARAGTTGAYAGELGSMGWYNVNSGSTSHAVKGKQANGWGLYDMHGNVWEWCADWYGAYTSESVTDPMGATSGSLRVNRGGGWNNVAGYCRSAYRGRSVPGIRNSNQGFRSVLSSSR